MASVNISADQISEARQQGYSDDQIAGFLSQKYPTQFQDATDNGYSSSDILNHFAPPPSQGSDVATGTEKALAQAPGKVIGTPGDLEAGTDWLSNKASGLIGGALGVSPSTQSTMDTTANAVGRIGLGAVYPPALLGSGLTSSTINNATGANSLPDAQTTLGQGAQLATGVASNPFSYLVLLSQKVAFCEFGIVDKFGRFVFRHEELRWITQNLLTVHRDLKHMSRDL